MSKFEEMQKSSLTLGIDIGGTNIKFGVVDQTYHIIKKWSIPTEVNEGDEHIVNNIIEKSKEIMKEFSYNKIGIGTPGLVDSCHGICVNAGNLPYNNTPIVAKLEKAVNVKVALANDATCAMLGEISAGVGRKYKNFIMLTLGTGIGGGICIDGKPYWGKNKMAGEFGHMTIQYNGSLCRCGRKGCYEQYASVSGLISQCKKAVENYPKSLLAQYASNNISGKTVFDAMLAGCDVASDVVNQYAKYIAIGIEDLNMIFAPEVIVIGGAISNQEDILLKPIKENIHDSINLCMSQLKNDAGIIGAAVIANQRD